MELKITRFFREAGMIDYSASAMEIGQDAGKVTWQAALDDADEYSILPDDDAREAFRQHVKGFGAWDAEEIAGWTDAELNALCMQFVAGDIRDTGMETDTFDWAEHEQGAHAGRYSGRLFRGDDGEVYYYLGD